MKAIIYLRVSTEEQGESGLGLEAQEATALDYCARRGFEVVEVVREVKSGKSAKKRPLLTTALDRCRRGEADSLVAPTVSRLARSVGDLAAMLEGARKGGYGIIVLESDLDLSTPAGKMVFQFLGVVAEWEREIIADRTKKALAAKKARGEKMGHVSTLPLATVTMIQTYRREGLSFGRIAAQLNAQGVATGQGGREWYASTARVVLLANGGEVLPVMSKGGRRAA